jgi:hypothetical protein
MKEFKPPYYKLIKIDGYRYVVDDSEIKDGDESKFIIHPSTNTILRIVEFLTDGLRCENIDSSTEYGLGMNYKNWKKLIASNNPDLSDLLWLPEPDGQEDIHSLSLKHFPYDAYRGNRTGIDDLHTGEALRGAYCQGYGDAKGKGTYSEDEVKDILMRAMFRSDDEFRCSNTFKRQMVDEWWSMNIPKPEPIGVELKIGVIHADRAPNGFESYIETKKVNGKQSVIVKRFIYE